MGLFERYLSVWVGLCILAGVALGNVLPQVFEALAGVEVARVNLVVAVLIWIMIYPVMVQVDFGSIRSIGARPKGLIITLIVNWLIKPFTMAALGWAILPSSLPARWEQRCWWPRGRRPSALMRRDSALMKC